MNQPVDKLWTSSFIAACVGNFLLFFAFYLLLPIFPLYLIESFNASKSMVGVVLSSYTVAALLVRPVAGFVLDMFRRKPLYLAAYFAFALVFISYPIVATLHFFLLFRILHGFAFGFVTTGANSLVVDIMPASRRGEGLGYFGVSNNLAMAFGPMFSLFLHDYYPFDVIFLIAIVSSFTGLAIAGLIKVEKPIVKREKLPMAFDRFFLFKGFQAGVSLLLIGIPYGMLMTYLSIYGADLGIRGGVGMFFSLMAVGLIFSRLFSGKMVDKGFLTHVISWGIFLAFLGILLLSGLKRIDAFSNSLVNVLFYVISLVLGVGYGMTFPAYNTLFVNLAPNNRRATASSTFMTSWDLGVGAGMVIGGMLADTHGGLPLAYLAGSLMLMFSMVYFYKIAGPHFERNKLR